MSTVGTMVTVPIQLYSLPSYEKPERPMQVIEVQGDRYGDWLCHRDIWTSGSEEHTRWEYGECWTVAYIPSGRTLARMLSEAAAREIAHVMALGAHPPIPTSASDTEPFRDYATPIILAAQERNPSPCDRDHEDDEPCAAVAAQDAARATGEGG